MGIIIALFMFQCNLHLNQDYCLTKHISCVEVMSTVKVGGLSTLNRDQRIAFSYMYCKESEGELSSELSYAQMYNDMKNNDSGHNLWEDNRYLNFYSRQYPKMCK